MTDRTELERQIAELQAQLAALPEVDPLLVEARELLVGLHERGLDLSQMPGTGLNTAAMTVMKSGAASEAIRAGKYDKHGRLLELLAALRRGMELAPRAVMDDAAVEALAGECVEKVYGGEPRDMGYARMLADAAIRATLSRVPAAAWPGEDELERMKDASNDGNSYVAMDRLARRLKAHMTGGAAKPEPEWIDWHGGECPVPAGTLVEYKLRRGSKVQTNSPETKFWKHYLGRSDIIAYRILGGAAKPEHGKVHTDGSRSGGQPVAEPEWIDWHGGECPVPAGTRVALKFSGGGLQRSTRCDRWNWAHHEGDPTNIIAYRILGGAA